MTLSQYFAQPGTRSANFPSANSPVGLLMVKILEKYPNTTFEAARTQANAMLDKAAGRFNYKMPRVYSADEMEKRREAFSKFKPVVEVA